MWNIGPEPSESLGSTEHSLGNIAPGGMAGLGPSHPRQSQRYQNLLVPLCSGWGLTLWGSHVPASCHPFVPLGLLIPPSTTSQHSTENQTDTFRTSLCTAQIGEQFKRDQSAFKSLDGGVEGLPFCSWRGLQDEMRIEKLDGLVWLWLLYHFSSVAFLYVEEASVKQVGEDLLPLVPFSIPRNYVQNLPPLGHTE